MSSRAKKLSSCGVGLSGFVPSALILLMLLSCIFVVMEVIKDILINLAANAVWAMGGIALIYFARFKKIYFGRYKRHALKKIQGFDWSPIRYPLPELNTSSYFKKKLTSCYLLLKNSFLFPLTEQSFKKKSLNRTIEELK